MTDYEFKKFLLKAGHNITKKSIKTKPYKQSTRTKKNEKKKETDIDHVCKVSLM